METVIQIQHLQKHFGNLKVLNDVDFDIHKGEVVTIIGSSGSGKSTMLRCVNLLERMDGGHVLYHGKDILSGQMDVNEYRSKVGMVFQSFNLFNNLTVLENCMLGQIRVLKKSREEAKATALKFLDEVGMKEFANKPSTKLSGGQKQRVAIGAAIIRQPKAFLMDEPLSNLDAKLRGQMRIEISKLHQRLGTTIIYVTHDQTEAMTLGTRIVVMNAGVVQQVDTPQVLYDTPCNLFVAGFIGSPQMNFLDAVCQKKGDKVVLKVGPADIELPPAKAKKLIDGGYEGKTVVLGIRPEDVHDEQMFITSSPNTVIQAKIRVYEMLGAEVYLHFDYEGATMTARVDSRTTARTGDTVTFAFDAEKIHVFDKETEKTITN